MEIVGKVIFMGHILPVYDSLDKPLFKASDVANIIDYSDGNVWKMLEMCEAEPTFGSCRSATLRKLCD